MTIINAGAWPTGRQVTRHQMPDGTIVEVTINWPLIRDSMARTALANKLQRTTFGPVQVAVVKP